MNPARAAVFGLVLLQSGLSQNAPVRTLVRPDAEFPEPFSGIRSVRELKDGRVIVTDLREESIRLINFATRTATTVSRKGEGPLEYMSVYGRLLAVGGDTTVLYGAIGRFLLIDPLGKPVGSRSAAGALNDFPGAKWGDARWRVYVDATPPGQRERAVRSSVVLRYDIAKKVPDTVARFRSSAVDVSVSEPRNGYVGMLTVEIPFSVHDDWAAFPDGRVAVVRGADYHVDMYPPGGAPVAGPRAAYSPLPVTEADRDSVRAARRPKGPTSFGQVPPIVEPSIWFPTKPPFGEQAAWAGPNGELWVEISRRAGDTAPKFDVFDRAGVRRSTVAFPAGSKLVGFGAHSAYVVRTDADDLQYLRRFDLRN